MKTINVKTLSGKNLRFSSVRSRNACNGSEELPKDVAGLKALIYRKEGIPRKQQILLSNCKQLKDEEHLSACSKSAEVNLHLLLGLRGGGSDATTYSRGVEIQYKDSKTKKRKIKEIRFKVSADWSVKVLVEQLTEAEHIDSNATCTVFVPGSGEVQGTDSRTLGALKVAHSAEPKKIIKVIVK